MDIGRLDEIVKNNVANSELKSTEAQKVYLLQDISETLAMIYDLMKERIEEEKDGEKKWIL